LDDIEKDRINHPERPLPTGAISATFASVLYFGSLGLALLFTSIDINSGTAWVYYFFAILMISYRFITEYLPTAKALYIAIAAVIPMLIITPIYPHRVRLYIFAGATFFHILGREMSMNVLDRRGDPRSFFHRFTERSQGIVSFASMAVGLTLLTILAGNRKDFIVVAVLAILLAVAVFYWFIRSERKRAVLVTKLQMLIALALLV